MSVPEPITCPSCGHRNGAGVETCWRCEQRLKNAAAPATSAASATPAAPAVQPPLIAVVPRPEDTKQLDPAVTGALEMAALGYPQIAVWGIAQTGATEAEAICMCPKGAACASPGKHPIVVGWQEMATTTPAVIKAWAKRNPGCNFGTPGGDGLWFVEFDPYQSNGHRLKDLRGFGIPVQAYSVSGKGVHIMGAGTAKNGQMLYTGATARSDGYMCVSPGSQHYTGRRYGRRKRLLPRDELPRFDIPEPKGPPTPPERAESTGLIPPGKRHEALKILASTLHNRGLSKSAGIEALKAYRDEDFDDTGREITDEEIEKIAEWMWKDDPRNPITPATDDDARPDELVAIDTIEVRPQEWLEKDWLPKGELGILAGWGDTGKSQILILKAAELGQGKMVGGRARQWGRTPPAPTLYISAEDNPETTIGARARAAGVPPGMMYVRKLRPEAAGIRIPEHLEWLRGQIQRTGARLIAFDPILAFVPTIYDSHKDQDTRNVLAPLAELAQEEGVGIVFIMHVNKGSGSAQLVARISGNNAWSNACRFVWTVKKEGEEDTKPDERTYVFHMPKHNLTQEQMPKRYKIDPFGFTNDKGEWIETSRVIFLGDAEGVDLSNFFEPSNNSDRTLLEEVIEAYHEILKDGPRPQTEVMEILKGQMGITAGRSTIYNAKKRAGIKAKEGADRTWTWAFAGHGHPTQMSCPVCDKPTTSNGSG